MDVSVSEDQSDGDVEDTGPKIEASSEMEEALREATESMEAREKGAAATSGASLSRQNDDRAALDGTSGAEETS